MVETFIEGCNLERMRWLLRLAKLAKDVGLRVTDGAPVDVKVKPDGTLVLPIVCPSSKSIEFMKMAIQQGLIDVYDDKRECLAIMEKLCSLVDTDP